VAYHSGDGRAPRAESASGVLAGRVQRRRCGGLSLPSGLDLEVNRILIATMGGELAGWLLLASNPSELTAHWARVLRVQTALVFRNCGVGRALMDEVSRAAAEDLALEQLRLEVRAGMGLEGFYQSCGWREIGRWPEALRLPGGDRDEVLMALTLERNAGPVGVR
jgi:GNAT superfamily N-acetyltransferase